MKRTAILLAALALWCGAAAQQTQPPRFQGADAKRFMARLMGETEKLAIEKQIPASELSPQVVVAFTVDTAGRVDGWRFLDNTCQGRDKCDAEPATERTKQLVTEALGRLEAWTPARKDGLSVSYTWRLTMRLPVEKIAKRQEADPLLFMGGDPDETFHEWARVRRRYDARFPSRRGRAGACAFLHRTGREGHDRRGALVARRKTRQGGYPRHPGQQRPLGAPPRARCAAADGLRIPDQFHLTRAAPDCVPRKIEKGVRATCTYTLFDAWPSRTRCRYAPFRTALRCRRQPA